MTKREFQDVVKEIATEGSEGAEEIRKSVDAGGLYAHDPALRPLVNDVIDALKRLSDHCRAKMEN